MTMMITSIQYYALLIITIAIAEGNMSFQEQLKIIETLMMEDTERCLELVASRQFISSLFQQELKTFTNMFETLLAKKNISSKTNNQGKNTLKPQLVIAMYSIIIMRSSVISIKSQPASNIATKTSQNPHAIYNVKMAIDTLTKIYKGLSEQDSSREILCGLLLKIPTFNNYKLVVKDVSPRYISETTMSQHFQNMRHQCPNLLENKLNEYKQQWSQYLCYKNIDLKPLTDLIDFTIEKEHTENTVEWSQRVDKVEQELKYLINRFELIGKGDIYETISIDDLSNKLDEVYGRLTDKLKDTAVNIKKSKLEQMQLEYDHQQFIHKTYQTIYCYFLRMVNQAITGLGLNWLRKIKWLYNFISTLFINFDVRGNNFHESIASQYSKIFTVVIQIITNYFLTFGSGLFPQNKLLQLAFNQQYSLYKLAEAILYNEYPFEQTEALQYQNYQKQRRPNDSKSKQYLIDTVNFNMKSLNINLHWDTLLIKIIPHMKNSASFAKKILQQALYFLLKYFTITRNYQQAPKLMLMLANAKNGSFTSDRTIGRLIKEIKENVYPDKPEVKEGIEYFCEQYFNQYSKHSKRRQEEQQQRKKKMGTLGFCQTDSLNINSLTNLNANRIKKTQSYDSMFEGWQHFESVKDSQKDNSISQLKDSRNRSQNMLQSVESVHNNQIFYSINQSKNEEIMESIKEQRQLELIAKEGNGEKKVAIDQKEEEEEQILMPEF